jgi:hypothetical protein
MVLRIIGDVHGKWGQYLSLIQGVDYSLQLGDLSLYYSFLKKRKVDPEKHVFFPGNHDNYDLLPKHNLGDFGLAQREGWPSVYGFFVRGAYSVDKEIQQSRGWWFPQEELNWEQCNQALDLYEHVKPRIMFTHDCPASLIRYVTTMPDFKFPTSSTQKLLEHMWQLHQPEQWFFGHHHRDWTAKANGTLFQCLNELSYCDLEV